MNKRICSKLVSKDLKKLDLPYNVVFFMSQTLSSSDFLWTIDFFDYFYT